MAVIAEERPRDADREAQDVSPAPTTFVARCGRRAWRVGMRASFAFPPPNPSHALSPHARRRGSPEPTNPANPSAKHQFARP